MSTPPPLSAISDPTSLGKLQILLVPVHPSTASPQAPILTDTVYKHWTSLIKHHTSIRSDEIPIPSASGSSHVRGGTPYGPRARFFPSSSATSVSRANTNQYVHLSYPAHPPARHLYPLSLLRMTAFPLVVIGIAVSDESTDRDSLHGAGSHLRGYSVDSEEGDIGEASTPRAAHFQVNTSGQAQADPLKALDDTIGEMFPPSSPFPLVKRVVVVPPTVPNTSTSSQMSPRKANGRMGPKGADARREVQHAPADGGEAWVASLAGEVVSDLLGELGELATALETPTGLKTLSSTLLPSLTSTLPNGNMHNFLPVRSPSSDHSRSNSITPTGVHAPSLDALNGTSSGGGGGMGITLKRALTPGGRPTSIASPSISPIDTSPAVTAPVARVTSSSNPFRRSTVLSSPFTRTSSAASITSNSSAGGAQSPVIAQRYTQANLTGGAGGRLMKLLGDFYLLVGQYGDAIKCYDDGAERCRVAGDVLWEGVAREGRAVAAICEAWEARDGSDRVQSFSSSPIPVEILAHYLSALSCISKAPLPYPPTILSPSPQAVSGSLNLPAPSAPGTVQLGTGEGLLAYLYTSLCLRIAHFQLIIWAAGGWGSIALSCLMGHTLPRTFPMPLDLPGLPSSSTRTPGGPGLTRSTNAGTRGIEKRESHDLHARRRRHRYLALLSSRSGLTRSSIYTNAESALGPHHRGMTKPEQLALHVEMIWLARYLDLPRHEAVVSREAGRKVAGMVVEGREEMRRLAKVGMGMGVGSAQYRYGHKQGEEPGARRGEEGDDASVGLGLGMAVQSNQPSNGEHKRSTNMAGVAVRRKESTEGNAALIHLLERSLTILGVDLLPPFPLPPTSLSVQRADDPSSPLSLLSGVGTRFGWPELQVDALQSAISVAEAMADHHNVARLSLSALKGMTQYLSPQSQGHLHRLVPAALGVLKRRGIWDAAAGVGGGVGWWVPGRFVLSLEVSSLPPNRLPVEHSTSEIQVDGKQDPFLYNPRIKAAQAGKTVLVANEQVDVFVTLSNPFAFDLEIADLGLITSGTPFLANPLPVLLPASSVQTIRITGTCPSPGTLSIQGVGVRLPDGAKTDVLMPMVNPKAKEKREKRVSRTKAERGRMKRCGLEARMIGWGSEGSGVGDEEGEGSSSKARLEGKGKGKGYELEEGEQWLECRVVEEQPLLWVKKSSLTHGTVMLYDGERTSMRLTLENSSSTPVNFIKLSFEDSTMREAQAALAEEITPRHAYEIQHDQLYRPVMQWDAEQKVEIKPGARASIAVECFGKVGCTDGSIRIDYGYIRDRDQLTNGNETPAGSATTDASFHTRTITFPILFTVYDTLEPHDLEIFPFPPRSAHSSSISSLESSRYLEKQSSSTGNASGSSSKRHLTIDVDRASPTPSRMPATPRSSSFAQAAARQDVLRKALEDEADDKHCLIALSVRNVFGVPFEVCLARMDGDGDKEGNDTERDGEQVMATRLVPPGATERLILPIPRLALSQAHLAQPIPTLGSRQYVIDKTGRTSHQIQHEQELFWYRQSLLSMLRLTYVEPGTKREGEVGLRRVTLEQLDTNNVGALKVEELEVRLWYESEDGGEAREGEFGRICCAVVNRLEHPITPQILIEAVPPFLHDELPSRPADRLARTKTADQAAKHIVFDGVLSRDLGTLNAGAEALHDVGVVFLAAGQYGFKATVRHTTAQEAGFGEMTLRISDILQVDVA